MIKNMSELAVLCLAPIATDIASGDFAFALFFTACLVIGLVMTISARASSAEGATTPVGQDHQRNSRQVKERQALCVPLGPLEAEYCNYSLAF
jgi:hypothetical protein